MKIVRRKLEKLLINKIQPNKVIVVTGARRVGKTLLIKNILSLVKEKYLFLNGDDINSHNLLANRTIDNYNQVIGDYKLLIIDEAQKIPQIGEVLKLMVDQIDGLKILITGSSAFDINNSLGEPLTGRKYSYLLYPFSESEYKDSRLNRKDRIKDRLVFGNYPELLAFSNRKDKIEYLNEIVSSYLLKDILVYEDIKNSHKLFNLLRLIAFQIGGEVSLQELGNKLQISKNTVEKYLNLLEKVYILHKVQGFSRNLRKEVTRNARWYFIDNGIRNAVISNFNPIEARGDIGQLWENYVICERLKYLHYNKISSNNFFWRTYDQQEIDWVEERDGSLFAFEIKWKVSKVRVPPQWIKGYPDSTFSIIHQDNFYDWVK